MSLRLTVLALTLAWLLAGCTESNPQPSPLGGPDRTSEKNADATQTAIGDTATDLGPAETVGLHDVAEMADTAEIPGDADLLAEAADAPPPDAPAEDAPESADLPTQQDAAHEVFQDDIQLTTAIACQAHGECPAGQFCFTGEPNWNLGPANICGICGKEDSCTCQEPGNPYFTECATDEDCKGDSCGMACDDCAPCPPCIKGVCIHETFEVVECMCTGCA